MSFSKKIGVSTHSKKFADIHAVASSVTLSKLVSDKLHKNSWLRNTVKKKSNFYQPPPTDIQEKSIVVYIDHN